MKKKIALLLVLTCVLGLVGCGSSKLVEGSEKNITELLRIEQ